MSEALTALLANHKHHQDYDDYGGYKGSELEQRNLEAIAKLQAPQPERHLTITTTESGEAVMVSWQDEDHRILEVVWERKVPASPVVSAEQIEDLAWLDVDEDGEIDRSSDHNKMMTAPQRCAFKRGARAILALRQAAPPVDAVRHPPTKAGK